ncbi:MAG: NlpC/P60 family protein [Hyphomicrobiaceae bacterium]
MTNAPPDPRLNAHRPDLAAESLRGKVDAPRYVTGTRRRVRRAAVPVRREPKPSLGLETEALFGEIVTVYDEADGWAWIQLEHDNYVGYVPADTLTAPAEPTHRVSATGTFLYAEEDIKSPPLMHLSINSRLTVTHQGDRFGRLRDGGFVISRHIAPIDRIARDFVDVAERLIGTPYLWGGRTRIGLDCSGLIQISMQAAGLPCPRDTDMQQASLGESVLIPDSLEGLQRGDIVFWRGHVGVMSDGVMLVHANAHHMAAVTEPLSVAVRRISRAGSEIAAIRRLPALTA